MTTAKPLVTIPEVPQNIDPSIRRMLVALKEATEVRLGRRGDPLEEGVTKRDLIAAGIAELKRGGGLRLPGDADEGAPKPGELGILPPLPVAFQAIGVFGGCVLSWDLPQSLYDGHGQTEIWRSNTPTPTDREYVGTAVGSSYFDPVPSPDEVTVYYWIRFVSKSGRIGAFSGMVEATKLPDLTELLTRLSGEIDESVLSQKLNERLDNTETAVLEQAETVEGLSAQYTLRLNVNGYVSGFGAYNDGETSDFAVLADRFWIAPPNSIGRIKPFIVQDNKVYIDTAMIRDASIQAAQIGSVSFGRVVDGAGNPVTVVGGGLKAQYIQTDELWAALANINYAVIGSAQIKNASITAAKIQDLSVDTLKLAGNAVTIPSFAQAFYSVSSTSWVTVLSLVVTTPQAGWLYASSSGYIGYGNGWGATDSMLTIDGVEVSGGGGTEGWTNAAHSGARYVGAGSHYVELKFRSPSGMATIYSRSLFAMLVKK